jgi:hypothetical protein
MRPSKDFHRLAGRLSLDTCLPFFLSVIREVLYKLSIIQVTTEDLNPGVLCTLLYLES